MISKEEKHNKLWPFLRGYEELVKKHGFKIDIDDNQLQIVKLGRGFKEDPEYYLYLEELIDRASLGIIVVKKE